MDDCRIEIFESISINYQMHPSFEELSEQWLDGADVQLKNPKCIVSLAPERLATTPTSGIHHVRFGCMHVQSDLTDNEILAMMAQKKVLPATGREAMDFGRQIYRRNKLHYPLIARGTSYTLGKDTSYGTLLRLQRPHDQATDMYYAFGLSRELNLVWLPPRHFLVLIRRS